MEVGVQSQFTKQNAIKKSQFSSSWWWRKKRHETQLLPSCRKAHQAAELWEMSSWRRAVDGPAALETSLRGVRNSSDAQTMKLEDKNVNIYYHLGALLQ